MKQHPVVGDQLCGNLRALARVRTIVRHHHERLDGSGYPDGLEGDAIPLLAQIIGIVDVYDAITTDRRIIEQFRQRPPWRNLHAASSADSSAPTWSMCSLKAGAPRPPVPAR